MYILRYICPNVTAVSIYVYHKSSGIFLIKVSSSLIIDSIWLIHHQIFETIPNPKSLESKITKQQIKNKITDRKHVR